MCIRYTGKRTKLSYQREPYITHEEWASKHVYFSGTNVSPIPGSFQIKYSPHYKKLFELMDRPEVRAFYAKWASQSGKSLFEVILIGKKLDTDPANVTLAFPIKDDIKKLVERKVDPVLKGMKRLWSKFSDYRVAESVRASRELKQLAGGSLLISGSGVKDRKSDSMPLLVMDEIGEFEEGAVAEFTERLKAFSKFFAREVGVSTVVHKTDEICTNYNAMETKIEWRYICSECGESFYPEPEYFKYISKEKYKEEIKSDDIELHKYRERAKQTAHIECPHCSYQIDSKEKDEMILNQGMDWFLIEGDWDGVTIGADLNSFGSFFVSYDEIVDKLISAGDNEAQLEKIYRGYFNRFYEVKYDEVNEEDILLIGNELKEWEIPEDTYKIYMGVDTQKDHFWYEVKAFCYGNISHTISWGRLETFGEIEDVWNYGQNLQGHGDIWQIAKMGIDRRGYNQEGVRRTEEVDTFVEYMVSKYKVGDENRIYAIEGEPKLTGDKPFTVVSMKQRAKEAKKSYWNDIPDIKIIKMSNLYMKGIVSRAIERTISFEKAENEEARHRFDDMRFYVDEDTIEVDKKGTISTSYTRQITAEVFGYEKNKKTGKVADVKTWFNPKQADNHITDTSCICYTFAQQDNINLERKPIKTKVEKTISKLSVFN